MANKIGKEQCFQKGPLLYFLAFLSIKVLIQTQSHKFSITMFQNIYMNVSYMLTKDSKAKKKNYSEAVNMLPYSNLPESLKYEAIPNSAEHA